MNVLKKQSLFFLLPAAFWEEGKRGKEIRIFLLKKRKSFCKSSFAFFGGTREEKGIIFLTEGYERSIRNSVPT